MKNEVKEDNFESCIIKNGGMFREIVRFFMGKKKWLYIFQ